MSSAHHWRLNQQVREAQRARIEYGNRCAGKEPLQIATPPLSRLRGLVGEERRATKGGLRRQHVHGDVAEHALRGLFEAVADHSCTPYELPDRLGWLHYPPRPTREVRDKTR